MKKANRNNGRMQPWFLIALGHSLITVPLGYYAFELPFRISILSAVAVYMVILYFSPGRFYRRMFVALLATRTGLLLASTIVIAFKGYFSDARVIAGLIPCAGLLSKFSS